MNATVPAVLPAYAPLRTLADIEAIESVPLAQRILRWDFALSLLEGCRKAPAKPAIHVTDRGNVAGKLITWCYSDLERHACQVANLLRASGLAASDAVAVIAPAVPGLYAAMLGAFIAARPFPVNWMLDAHALADLLKRADAKAVVALGPTADFQIWDNVQAAVKALGAPIPVFSLHDPFTAPHPDDLLAAAAHHPHDHLGFGRESPVASTVAAYVHSGGTTGHPKIVKLTHGGLVYRQWASNQGLALTSEDVALVDTPMFHIGGLCVRGLVPIADGMTVVIPSMLGARDRTYIANYWRYVERFGITQISGVPTTLSVLAKNPPTDEDISSLRPYFSTGSTPMAPAVRQRIFEVTGARPLMMYGLTENTSNVTIEPRDGPAVAGSSGLRVPYTHFRVVEMDDEGRILRDCAVDEPGMVLVTGPGVAAGYLDSTQDEGVFLSDGTLVTGDLGSVDAGGNLRISGRRKDIIIRGGHNIEPLVIEEALAQSTAVALVAAIGRPDAHAGELPIAYVQLHEGAVITAEELLAFATARIPERAAVPKEIILIDKLPLSPVGKPLKHVLQRDAALRVFREALRGLPGRWDLDVSHAGARGLRVTLRLHRTSSDVREGAHAILSTFSTAFVIEDAEVCVPPIPTNMDVSA
jgi:fatty-acyl-CoA synthase